jgi:glycosyltransferase involved in cell wall biosynthesis
MSTTPVSAPLAVTLVDPSNFTIPYDLSLLEALRAEGMQARLACRRSRPGERPLPQIGVDARFYRCSEPLLRQPGLGRAGRWLKGAEHLLDSVRLLAGRDSRQTVLHYQWFMLPSLDSWLLRRLKGQRRLVVTVHDTEPLSGSTYNRLQTVGLVDTLGLADHLVVHTDESRQRLLRAGLPAHKLHVIAHPVLPLPAPEQGDLPTRLHRWWQAPVRLLLFGHLKAYKGIDILLEALATLSAGERAGVQVLMAGRSAYGDGELERRIKAAGLDDILAVDDRFLPDGELSAVLHHASLLLFPYLQIDASGAILSAVQLGKPMILSRLPTILQTIPTCPHGHYVEPGNSAALADMIRRLTSNGGTPLAQTPSAPLVLPSWQDMARQLARLYAVGSPTA